MWVLMQYKRTRCDEAAWTRGQHVGIRLAINNAKSAIMYGFRVMRGYRLLTFII